MRVLPDFKAADRAVSPSLILLNGRINEDLRLKFPPSAELRDFIQKVIARLYFYEASEGYSKHVPRFYSRVLSSELCASLLTSFHRHLPLGAHCL